MFNGRYGADKLGVVMGISSMLLTAVAALLSADNIVMKLILIVMSACILCYAAFRVFSKNIRMRTRELRALEAVEMKLLSMFGRRKRPPREDIHETEKPAQEEEETVQEEAAPVIEYRRFCCPKCKKPLKVPVGKGYIKVICPACSNKFMKHT
ncbi:MAG: hypothetical protein IJO93_04145 [Clostridia bacterium]|nr:hypothetical protein [Clostridia bacterium]